MLAWIHLPRTAQGIWRCIHTRVRYAPSPTGALHLGGLRTALYNFLFAQHTGGTLVLRIEDTDRSRMVRGAVEQLRESLEWAGLSMDEGPWNGGPYGPYTQSDRLDLYRQYATQLLESGHAYPCYCTPDRLESLRKAAATRGIPSLYDRFCLKLSEKERRAREAAGQPCIIRLKIPTGSTFVHDRVHGCIPFPNHTLDDQVLLKSDGFPTYHLASVVDDHLMHITHVIRGEEWLSSTPKHVILYQAFGWNIPEFAHLPLLLNTSRSKLSKRMGDTSVEEFRQRGYLPEAILNFVLQLGWTPLKDSTKEFFTPAEMIREFSLEGVHKAASVVDVGKLGWFNKLHMRYLVDTNMEELIKRVRPMLEDHTTGTLRVRELTDEAIAPVLQTMKERLHLLADIPDQCLPFFVDPDHPPPTQSPHTVPLLCDLCARIEQLSPNQFVASSIHDLLITLGYDHALNMKEVFRPVRLALTGTDVGAGLPVTMETLGQETTLRRLRRSCTTNGLQ